MTRGTLFYYESAAKVWSSTEFNGDMYHGTPENPEGNGDKVIRLMQGLKSLNDFKEVLEKVNMDYGYDEGNNCWSISKAAIEKDMKAVIKCIDTERPDLKGDKRKDPRMFDKVPTFKDVTTWQFWGTPNLSDYSYIYNNSKRQLTLITKGDDGKTDKMVIPSGAVGVLNYGHNDCICKDGKIIDDMGNYKETTQLEAMTKQQSYQYIIDNFTLDHAARTLVLNILDYVQAATLTEQEKQDALSTMLDGIGLEDEEIKRITL